LYSVGDPAGRRKLLGAWLVGLRTRLRRPLEENRSRFRGVSFRPGGILSADISATAEQTEETTLKKTFVTARNIIGVAGLILAGYVIISSIPDLGRYIKISQM
jgi:hypothetical protein